MPSALTIAATGMAAQQLNVEVLANNIANLNTTGFKRQRVAFEDLLYQERGVAVGTRTSEQGSVAPSGVQVGVGVKPAGVYRIHAQGSLVGTENPLDIAVNGRGYFQITLPSGETGYTRAGSFQLSPTGEIVTPEGYQLQPGFTVPVDAKQISVSEQGVVQVQIDGQIQPVEAGRISLTTFPNDAGLQAVGGNYYKETPASGTPSQGSPGDPGFGVIRQGFLEASNVDIVSEITTLIAAQRAYEMNSKVIQASDEMLRSTSQMR